MRRRSPAEHMLLSQLMAQRRPLRDRIVQRHSPCFAQTTGPNIASPSQKKVLRSFCTSPDLAATASARRRDSEGEWARRLGQGQSTCCRAMLPQSCGWKIVEGGTCANQLQVSARVQGAGCYSCADVARGRCDRASDSD